MVSDQVTATIERNTGSFIMLVHRENARMYEQWFIYQVLETGAGRIVFEFANVNIFGFLDHSQTHGLRHNVPLTDDEAIACIHLDWEERYYEMRQFVDYGAVGMHIYGTVIAIARID